MALTSVHTGRGEGTSDVPCDDSGDLAQIVMCKQAHRGRTNTTYGGVQISFGGTIIAKLPMRFESLCRSSPGEVRWRHEKSVIAKHCSPCLLISWMR